MQLFSYYFYGTYVGVLFCVKFAEGRKEKAKFMWKAKDLFSQFIR